jgi:two-component system, OmpR family, response regulator
MSEGARQRPGAATTAPAERRSEPSRPSEGVRQRPRAATTAPAERRSEPSGPSEGAGPARLLVVDDEPNIVALLGAALRMMGYLVDTATTGREALAAARAQRPDLVLLDVMLPDHDGFSLTGKLRAHDGRLPVVFLSARNSTADRIAGLSVGGDDYVTKPFSLEEVRLRIEAVLRRTRGQQPDDAGLLCYADLELDEGSHQVRRAGQLLELSPTEFRLLRYLMQTAGKVVSKPQILRQVWRYDFDGDTRIVESYISLLRRKIDTGGPQLIQTVRGVGYSLRHSPGDRRDGG